MVKLPEDRKEMTIKDMPEGIEMWTVPWAMYADEDGNMYLNCDYSVGNRHGGTAQMSVRKLCGAYMVDITRCPAEKWSPGTPYYVGHSIENDIPVSKLIS